MRTLPFLALVGILAACSSQPKQDVAAKQAHEDAVDQLQRVTKNSNDSLPPWIFFPKSDKGLASSSCVNWSGNITVDRAQVIAAARADMAQQIQVKASVLDKLYNRKTSTADADSVGGTFEQVSKQLTNETLQGSVPEEIAMAQLDGKKVLCAMVVMGNTQEVFDQMITQSRRELDPTSKAALYEEFRSQKAMDELETMLNQN